MSIGSRTPDPRSALPLLSRSELAGIIRRRLEEGDDELGRLVVSVREEKADSRTPAAIVQRFLRRYAARSEHGFIEDSYGFSEGLRRLFGRAAEAAEKGNQLFAVQLIGKAVEAGAPHVYEGGDEEGEIMDAVQDGFERLTAMAQASTADPAALRELSRWALDGVDAEWARDGDSWDMVCLGIASVAAQGEAEAWAVLDRCSIFTKNRSSDWNWTYRAERAALIAADLLKRRGDQAARRGYIDKHLFLDDIRKLAVDEAMEARDYSLAIGLCRDGVGVSRTDDRRGPANHFAERLVEALDLAGEKEEAAKELESLVIESYTYDRFAALKKRYSVEDSWIAARDRVIAALEKDRRHSALASIYKAEHMSERLLAVAEKNSFLFREYLDTIGRAYPERAARFLKDDVERGLRLTASRGSYARSAETILRYGKYAGKEAAQALFDSFLVAYPARRAMREEFALARRRGNR